MKKFSFIRKILLEVIFFFFIVFGAIFVGVFNWVIFLSILELTGVNHVFSSELSNSSLTLWLYMVIVSHIATRILINMKKKAPSFVSLPSRILIHCIKTCFEFMASLGGGASSGYSNSYKSSNNNSYKSSNNNSYQPPSDYERWIKDAEEHEHHLQYLKKYGK